MEASELRLGNYIFDRNNQLCKVIELSEVKINAPVVDWPVTGLPHKLIPINEEWIIKFGFEKDDIVDEIDGVLFVLFHLGDYIIEHWINEGVFKFTDDCSLIIQISSVHQLQNLYFALTGEELTVNN